MTEVYPAGGPSSIKSSERAAPQRNASTRRPLRSRGFFSKVDGMDYFETVESRHSYRGPFLKAPVPRDDLRKIVEAGIRAPSGYNAQTTSFVVVDDAELLGSAADILGKPALREAPALIVVLMDDSGSPNRDFRFGVEDYAAATENILLAATALGYASVWIDGALRSQRRAERIAELLGVPSPLEVRVVLPVGVPAEKQSQGPKKAFEERAAFNRAPGRGA